MWTKSQYCDRERGFLAGHSGRLVRGTQPAGWEGTIRSVLLLSDAWKGVATHRCVERQSPTTGRCKPTLLRPSSASGSNRGFAVIRGEVTNGAIAQFMADFSTV